MIRASDRSEQDISTLLTTATLVFCAAPCVSAGPTPRADDYVVFCDSGPDEAFLPAAELLAQFHEVEVVAFDTRHPHEALQHLRAHPPRFVAWVLPPDAIDIDLSNTLLTLSTMVDEDVFPDFAAGFITGRDGEHALAFVERVIAAWDRDFQRRGGWFGSWEGITLPPPSPMSATAALGFEFEDTYVHARADEEAQRKSAREALEGLGGKDVMLFFSHGYPDRMACCFRAQQLRDWSIDFGPAVLFNCACYNGAPSKWHDIGPGGRFVAATPVSREDSVALQILDSGVSGYFSGINPWHGWLNNQVFLHVADDGLALGDAARRMIDRLALEFHPERIQYPPADAMQMRGEGRDNRRRNGAGMIFYGDPAFAPYADRGAGLASARWEEGEDGADTLLLASEPMVVGRPGADFMLPQSRLMNYYSVVTSDVMNELGLEVYRVVDLPAGTAEAPTLEVVEARSGDATIPIGPLQVVLERTPDASRLHVRAPVDAPMLGTPWLQTMAVNGFEIRLRIQ